MDTAFRKKTIIIFIIVIITKKVFAGNDEEFFLRGNKHYEKKEYDQALTAYEMISKKGRAVFYNMGNCYYHKNDYPQAIVYWTRAQDGATSQENQCIEQNKKKIFDDLGKKVDNNSNIEKIINIFYRLNPYFSLLVLQLFFLLFWYLLFYSAKRQWRFKKMILFFLFILSICTLLLLSIYYIKKITQMAIVVKKESLLLTGPNKDFHVIAMLDQLDSIVIKEKREGWYKIRYADMIGWVEADAIQII